MTSAHGRPTAAELIAAVAEFLETDVRESTAGHVNFHARVAANALRIVERELLADAETADAVAGALARVGCVDEAQLAAAIRGGELDGATTTCNRRCVRWSAAGWRPRTPATRTSREIRHARCRDRRRLGR